MRICNTHFVCCILLFVRIAGIMKVATAVVGYINKNGLAYDSKYYKDDNHGAVPLIAEYDGLHFYFQLLSAQALV